MLSDLARIPLRKLFLVTVSIKLTASFLAWLLTSPWILGFWVPIIVMLVYIALGFKRAPGEVSDERFGDSCYYLGFIFTISSIAFSLFDVPQLNEAGKLKDVAVRFGAAMVSTLLGFVVRVYLVGFRRDSTEALQSLEEQIIASANALQSRLDLSREAYELFSDKIQKATSDTEARVRVATEGVGLHLSKEMAVALKAIAADVQRIHITAAGEVREAGNRMAADLTKCCEALIADVNRSQAIFIGLEEKLTARLDAVTFPDDYFTKELAPPLHKLVGSVTTLGTDLTALKTSVQQSAKGLAAAMAKVEVAMEIPQSVRDLVVKQETLGKEVLAGMATTSVSLQGSAAAMKDQGDLLARILEQMTGTQARQTQSAATLQQISQALVTSQKTHQQVADEIGRLIRQLADLQRSPPPVPTPIPPSVPAPIRVDGGASGPQSGPLSPPPVLPAPARPVAQPVAVPAPSPPPPPFQPAAERSWLKRTFGIGKE